ncbi:uncharacterized protein LOC34621943 [Cyclospora cayetanensis]|uniref:Uncharacterized protein LOC34621943 n=1 Tax=Cyclospora cayetanensis TaxID=88456 RepID=A0A6P6RWI5_9EIME|nr:uncharacterized protein LOC34621943 [Cyclospora cayetanensis]
MSARIKSKQANGKGDSSQNSASLRRKYELRSRYSHLTDSSSARAVWPLLKRMSASKAAAAPAAAAVVAAPAAAAAAASAAAQTEVVDSPRGVPVVLRQPLLLASCSPSALNVFALVAHAMRVVYEAEGVSGLFRGLVPSCLHRLGRDCLHWLLLRHCYRGTVFLTRGVFATVGECESDEPKVGKKGSRAENQREDSPEGSCEDGKDGKDSSSSSGSGRLFAELATYPLLVVSTRLAVIESPFPLSPPVFLPRVFSLSGFFGFAVDLLSSQMVVGTSEMLYLTLKADGAGAFWRGAVPYILSRSVDEAQEEDSPVERRLQQLEEYTIRAWLSAILGTAAAPLAQLSVIQRCQSTLQGLCQHKPWLKVLSGMPWKALATSHRRLSAIESEEEEELM